MVTTALAVLLALLATLVTTRWRVLPIVRAPSPPHGVAPSIPAWLPGLGGAAPRPPAPPLGMGWLALHPSPDLGIHAEGAVLVDVDSREVVWARDQATPRPPASLTKLLNVMVAADLATSLEQAVTVPVEATQVESDSTLMGLSAGEVVTVRDLLYGIFLDSGNDAAETLARVFTDRAHFMRLMNEKAAALGMRHSHFTNPSGLDDPGLRASPYDLAVAAVTVATRYPKVMAIAGTRDAILPATATHKAFSMHTLIDLVSAYPGATGLKTGYTDDAGYCLVGTATRGDRHLAVVVMHSDPRMTVDAMRLLDYGFSQPRPIPGDPANVIQL